MGLAEAEIALARALLASGEVEEAQRHLARARAIRAVVPGLSDGHRQSLLQAQAQFASHR
jgi:hypothetical protein